MKCEPYSTFLFCLNKSLGSCSKGFFCLLIFYKYEHYFLEEVHLIGSNSINSITIIIIIIMIAVITLLSFFSTGCSSEYRKQDDGSPWWEACIHVQQLEGSGPENQQHGNRLLGIQHQHLHSDPTVEDSGQYPMGSKLTNQDDPTWKSSRKILIFCLLEFHLLCCDFLKFVFVKGTYNWKIVLREAPWEWSCMVWPVKLKKINNTSLAITFTERKYMTPIRTYGTTCYLCVLIVGMGRSMLLSVCSHYSSKLFGRYHVV